MARLLVAGIGTVLVGTTLFACGSSGDANDNGAGIGNRDGGAAASGDAASAGASTGASSGEGGIISVGSGGTGGGKGGAGGAGGASGGSGTGSTSGAGGGVTSVTPVGTTAPACVSDKSQATNQPLDIFIMEDRSGSMKDATSNNQSKWTVITNALSTFVKDPKSAGIGAGIGFFSVSVQGDGGDPQTSCDPADYATPAVGIAPLNGNAAAIVKAIGAVSPGGNTPTEPALQGAITYAESWATKNPTHKVIVVFATDGLPNGCNSTVQGAATIAASGVAKKPSIATYVVGVFGSKDCPNGLTQACTVVQNTNAIAKGGGTRSAFIVDTGGNTEAQFVAAMNAIRTANAAKCDYTIPPAPSGKLIDPTHATVQYTTGTAKPVPLAWIAKAASCPTTGGWFYDSVTSPGKIHLCPTSCTAVQGDPTAKVEVLLACTTPNPAGGTGGASGAGGAAGTGGASGAGGTAGATGAGGSSGATGTGGSSGAGACLLDGQSCQTGADCCSGLCSGGICSLLR